MKLFEINAELPRQQDQALVGAGVACLLVVWGITAIVAHTSMYPTPWAVALALPDLHFNDALIRNLAYSIKLNLWGYLEAIVVSLPLGFVIGLFPVFRSMFNKPVDALRFVPLTALTGMFIVWFGIEDRMKVHFLAFGIIVYLLPVVVQRIREVLPVYHQTVKTLGASRWQTIKSVYIPDVTAKVSADIRVLVAISWTYIIVAEMVNNSAGVGGLTYICARQSRIDKVFALLLVIVAVGFLQDLALRKLDELLFPYKQQSKK